MTRVLHHPHPDEALIPVATSRRAPVAPSAPLPAKRAHAAEILRELRAADTTPAALGMRRPTAPTAPQPPAARPMPGIATIAYLSAVSVAIRIDHAVHQDTLHVIDDIRTLLDGRPELLALLADAVKAGC